MSPDDDVRDALDRLSRVYGEGSLRACVLALVMDDAMEAVRTVWREETADVPGAADLLATVARLGAAFRLPVLDALLARVRDEPKADRRRLLQAFRRIMAARGTVRPLDRLQWLQMRRQLGDRPLAPPVPAVAFDGDEPDRLPPVMRLQVAAVTAYLSRIVPDGSPERGGEWYAAVLQRFMPLDAGIPRALPDGDRLASALDEVITLPWMLRPVLLRAWVDAALGLTWGADLARDTADALRLAASLLDSPMAPVLARHHGVVGWAETMHRAVPR